VTLEEANKIIAEYMGYKLDKETLSFNVYRKTSEYVELDWFSSSLDALVPVWEKITKDTHPQGIIIESTINCNWDYSNFGVSSNWPGPKWQKEVAFESETGGGFSEEPKSIQEAACLATAKAIKELND